MLDTGRAGIPSARQTETGKNHSKTKKKENPTKPNQTKRNDPGKTRLRKSKQQSRPESTMTPATPSLTLAFMAASVFGM